MDAATNHHPKSNSILMYSLSFTVLLVPLLFSNSSLATASNAARAIARSKYTTPHSLGDTYSFDPRDGWEHVNLTDLSYKYAAREQVTTLAAEEDHGTKSKRSDLVISIKGVADQVWKGFKGFGKKQDATITWYTGQDLEHPSCWPNTPWAPTDKSFAAAVTMEGWNTRPECFRFLELCNTPKKCVFVRVIDTCAGCKKGSRHLDLTKAAFGALADFDQGILTAQYRPATDPAGWFEDLWGPKVGGKKVTKPKPEQPTPRKDQSKGKKGKKGSSKKEKL